VDETVSDFGEQVPATVVIAVRGNPAQELVGQARNADLLVLGSRGSGGFARLLLGSVASAVTHHADCPVVIVPANRP
jgi:nucleotide-binding universal stress UspA family protein